MITMETTKKRKGDSIGYKLLSKKLKWQKSTIPDSILFKEGGLLGFEEFDPSSLRDDTSTVGREIDKEKGNSLKKNTNTVFEAALKAKKAEKKKSDKGSKRGGKNSKNGDIGTNTDEKMARSSEEHIAGMELWDRWNINGALLKGLHGLGFTKPTPIQEATFTHSILYHKDIVGAAQTGSGKTLAYGLPILHHILENPAQSTKRKLQALIITPTRELAKQVVNHLREVAKFTPLRIIPVVGGVAIEKQERLLLHMPEIIVGTPGRLWELISNGNEYLGDFSHMRAVVLDEADRMVEVGHFQDLEKVFSKLPKSTLAEDEEPLEDITLSKAPEVRRQTFVFSATLVDIRLSKGKTLYKGGDSQATSPLDRLMQKVDFQHAVEIVNLSIIGMTAENVREAKVFCTVEEKDYYLYYLLTRYPGKTIVFVNAVEGAKRIATLLRHLKIKATVVHGKLSQKRRFASIERLTGDQFPVLVATDIAARGLDVPEVKHVIHYSIPRTVELYIHRAGRTARTSKDGVSEGTSVLLVGPEEYKPFYLITEALGKEYGIVDFPIDTSVFPAVIKRVDLAREVGTTQYHEQKENEEKRLLSRNRASLEDSVAVAEESSESENDDTLRKRRQRLLLDDANAKKIAKLNDLLKQPLIPGFARAGYSAELLYKTKSETPSAVTTVSREIEKQKTKQQRRETQDKYKEEKLKKKKQARHERRTVQLKQLQDKFSTQGGEKIEK